MSKAGTEGLWKSCEVCGHGGEDHQPFIYHLPGGGQGWACSKCECVVELDYVASGVIEPAKTDV